MIPRRPSRLLRAAVALAGLAALVAAAPASGAPAQLSATVAPAVVVYPDQAVIAGSVSVSRARVQLLARPVGAVEWSPSGTATAGADGAFRFALAPSVSTEIRLVYEGDAQHARASLDLRLGVRPRVTAAFPRGLWLGAAVTLSGAVAPAHPGAPVLIERRVEGVWHPFATATLDDQSRFALPWQPTEFGFYRLRARVAADTEHDDGVSPSERVTVNRPNRHDVPYRFEHYIVIVRHRYRLYYYEHGALVRTFDVALGRPGYRTPLGHFKIWAKRRPAGGALGWCAMYYRGSIAIHGTDQPRLLRRFPRAFSHGCARMYNREALWLYLRCPRGTPVHNLR